MPLLIPVQALAGKLQLVIRAIPLILMVPDVFVLQVILILLARQVTLAPVQALVGKLQVVHPVTELLTGLVLLR